MTEMAFTISFMCALALSTICLASDIIVFACPRCRRSVSSWRTSLPRRMTFLPGTPPDRMCLRPGSDWRRYLAGSRRDLLGSVAQAFDDPAQRTGYGPDENEAQDPHDHQSDDADHYDVAGDVAADLVVARVRHPHIKHSDDRAAGVPDGFIGGLIPCSDDIGLADIAPAAVEGCVDDVLRRFCFPPPVCRKTSSRSWPLGCRPGRGSPYPRSVLRSHRRRRNCRSSRFPP